MKFFTLAGFALGAVSTLLDGVLAEPRPQPKVDRLISKRHLEKRGVGFANGGDHSHGGKGPGGKPRSKDNYELSLYHINDVHA